MIREKGALPDFLVIGSQKSGTTTLYADLDVQPAICMSTIKEPSVLLRFSDPHEAAGYYRRLLLPRPRHQRFGEASTLYTQLPTYPTVAHRAKTLLGPELGLIYLVRDPVERTISHHYHAYSRGRCGRDINTVVRDDPQFVAHGRYAMQLEPWLREFGAGSLLILRFEDYIRDRPATVRRVGEFLSVPIEVDRIETDRAFNKSEGNRTYGRLRPFLSGDLWRMRIRPLIPERLRQRLRDRFLARAPERPPPPTPETIDYLIEQLAPDAERLRAIVGQDQPLWDLEATRARYAQPVGSAPGSGSLSP
jgi:hypothetical protein